MVVHKMEYPYFLFTSLLLVGLSSPHGNLDPITWKPLVIVDYPNFSVNEKGCNYKQNYILLMRVNNFSLFVFKNKGTYSTNSHELSNPYHLAEEPQI